MAAIAPPGAVELSWEAPAGCPDEHAVRGWVASYAVDAAEPAPVQASGSIVALADGYALALTIAHGEQTEARRLTHAECEPLARAAALVVAVNLDPVAVANTVRIRPEDALVTAASTIDEQAPVRDPVDAPPPTAEPPPPRAASLPAVPSRRATDASSGVRVALRPEFSVGGGILPAVAGVGFGGALAVFGATPWRAELGGAYWLARRAAIAGTDAGGDLWLAAAVARGCYVATRRPLSFPVCGGVEVGALSGEGFGPGLAVTRNADTWVGAPLGAGLLWAPIRAIALMARAEAIVALRRPGFHLDGIGEVHRTGAIGARAVFGFEVRFF